MSSVHSESASPNPSAVPRHDLSSLIALLVAQFFGAANDNLLKGIVVFMLVNGVWADHLGQGGQSYANFAFTLPFILFSGYGGQVADRISKTQLARFLKWIEIPIAALAGAALWHHQLWLSLLALTALSTHSAFFGPVKWGLLPDLVRPSYLPNANGLMNMLTNIAAIVAMVAAGAISDLFAPKDPSASPPLPWLPLAAMIAVALLGLLAVTFVVRLPKPASAPVFETNPFLTYFQTLRAMSRGPLLDVVGAWAYFYLIAQIALTMIPEYTVVLEISNTKASYILATIAVAIGIGSIAVGLLSRGKVSARFVPVGASGMCIGFVLLGMVTPRLENVIAFIAIAGFFAGFYVVPLQALMQRLAPPAERGVYLGTANALCFGSFFVGSALYKMVRPFFGQAPQHAFLVCAALIAAGLLFFWLRLGRAISREF